MTRDSQGRFARSPKYEEMHAELYQNVSARFPKILAALHASELVETFQLLGRRGLEQLKQLSHQCANRAHRAAQSLRNSERISFTR